MSALTGYIDGEWKPLQILGMGAEDGSLIHVEVANPPGPTQSFQVGPTLIHGPNFSPVLGVGLSATFVWRDSETGEQLAVGPTPHFAEAGSVTLFATDLNAIQYLNCGFNNTQDSGIYNIGAPYDYPTQPLTGIENLNSLQNLVYFMCNNSGLVGGIDFSNMTHLLHIECYTAKINSVNLTGCTSLVRLCLEQNALNFLDLNPVSATLRDLRAAVQSGTLGQLEFATITGSMQMLYHYCVRDQKVLNHIPFSKMPAIVQRWDWNTHVDGVITNFEAPTSFNAVLNDYLSYFNPYSSGQLDAILVGLLTVPTTGRLILSGSGNVPSSTGLAAMATLISNGWNIESDWT